MKFSFGKFVKDIVKKEEVEKGRKAAEEKIDETLSTAESLRISANESIQGNQEAQRLYNKLYREKWQNSVKFIRGKK